MSGLCRCSHLAEYHQIIRRRVICLGSPVCGCGEYREDDGNRWPPAEHRDDYDPPGPIDRKTK